MQAAASVEFVAADAAAESDASCVDAGAAAVDWPIAARVACAGWNLNWLFLVEQESCSVVVVVAGNLRRSYFLTSHLGNERPKQDSNCAKSVHTIAARTHFSIK